MVDADPILGVTPPEANKPPEPTPPISEGTPKGGMKVECRQPELLYEVAKGIVNGSRWLSIEVSSTEFDDDGIFSKERTELSGFDMGMERTERIKGTFKYGTWIDLSRKRIERDDHGYFNNDKVDRINDKLVQAGLRAVVDHEFISGYQNRIIIEINGYYIEVNFLYPSRETEAAKIIAKVEEEKGSGEEDDYIKDELTRVEKGLENRWIKIGLVDKLRAQTGIEGYPKLKDQADFLNATKAYVDVYQQVLQAIYAEEGVIPKDNTIILRPPILDADTFTQIKRTETSLPAVITPDQLIARHVIFDEIAGQEFAVSQAKRLVRAINNPEVYERRGVEPPKGILLYGPPGTGKTLIAKAIASESQAAFLEISVSDIGDKWFGESEKLTQKLFDRANELVAQGKKVIMFFDEIDALAPSREGAHEATRKIVATLLQNMDGWRSNPNVTIIAATNRPQDIDEALRRAGRFNKLIPVGLPSEDGRVAILRVHMDKAVKRSTTPDELFSPDIDMVQLGKVTEGMSGADIANLVNLTLEEKADAELEGGPWTPVSTEDMVATARKLGLFKEEKRKIGFLLPEKNGNGSNRYTPIDQSQRAQI